MDRLVDFASSVPDFRRTGKGNHRHRLRDIIMLMVLGRASGFVGRADIIAFGKHNIKRFRKMGMFIIAKTKSAILKNEKYIFWCFPAISGASV